MQNNEPGWEIWLTFAAGVFVTVGLVSGSAYVGLLSLDGSYETAFVDAPAEKEDSALNVSTDIKCLDHETRDGDRRHECRAHVFVHEFGDAVTVEVRAVDGISFETKVWTVHPPGEFVYAYAASDGASELTYGDAIFVRATFENGSSARILSHEFSCEDVDYRKACRSSAKGGEAHAE